ncbi:protein kinase family protein [Desulfosarcina alkanivorans]|nr:serine/threonine-protein kinase [Desulfosarcina alkanivorans]
MKKWIIVVVFSALCTLLVSLVEVDVNLERQIIYIDGAEPVLADRVSESDQFVFYETDGKSGMFMKADVTSVGSVQVTKKTALLTILDQTRQQIMADLGFNTKIIRATDPRLIVFLVILAVASGFLKLILMLAASAKKMAPQPSSDDALPSAADQPRKFIEEGKESSDLRDIAMFFLELYKLQNGLKKDAAARFSMTPASATSKMKVFELGVKGNNDWLTRRMSVGPLGEDTGSKSKCFYVIYDTHMVVKIPPVPVTDMVKYVRDIRREVQIAAHLSPVACIVPMVSVVLKKVKKLPYESSLTQEQLEKQYIRLVEEKPEYQEYLKIGNRFAFFMELTNNFFLARVIDELHASKNKTGDEIREVPDVAWDQEAFTTRYGLASLPVFEGLQTLYRNCEAEAGRIIKASRQGVKVHPFQIKNWFLTCIAGEKIDRNEKGIGEALIAQIEAGFSDVFKANQNNVDGLVQLLRAHLETKTFMKSRQQIENIASNTLQLLCRLREKRIALRDLKPDNLFLDADPDNYPVFLQNAADFSIGVIDVETAISLIPTRDGSISQPLLGGTPLYATPLHLLKNRSIESHFGPLTEALYLEDWFATIAIIFKAITGRNLFPRAARSFPGILKILKSSPSRSDPDRATVKAMSQKFWSAAATDMKTHLSSFSNVLNQLTLSVPEAMAPAIRAELKRENECIQLAIRKHVALSPLFKSEKNREFLLAASSDTLIKQVNRWKNPAHLPEQHRQVAPKMVAFLNNLYRLKEGGSEKRRAISAFADPPHHVTAYSLLEAMFQIVFQGMYKSRWKAIPKSAGESARQAAVKEDRSMVTTILNGS